MCFSHFDENMNAYVEICMERRYNLTAVRRATLYRFTQAISSCVCARNDDKKQSGYDMNDR